MTYKIIDIDQCVKKIEFLFDKDILSSEIQKLIGQKRKTASIKGFRKGKAPVQLVEKLYGEELEGQALRDFISKNYVDAIETESLRPIGHPSFSDVQFEKGKEIKFNATVEVFPVWDFDSFNKVEIKREEVSVSEDEINKVKKNLQENEVQLMPVKDEAHKSTEENIVVVNAKFMDGDVELENLSMKESVVDLANPNGVHPEFNTGLVGLSVGSDFTFELKFDDNSPWDLVKGKNIKVSGQILEIKEKVYPEFDDKFVSKHGYTSVKNFEEKLKERIFENKKLDLRKKMEREVLDKLYDMHSFTLPASAVETQKSQIKEELVPTLKQYGMSPEKQGEYFDQWKDDIKDKAEFRVRSGIILESLGRKFNVSVEEEDITQKLNEVSNASGKSYEGLREEFESSDRLKSELMYAVKEEKTFNILLDKISYID